MPRSDALRFVRRFISDPLRIGAIAPSSAALADAITAEIGLGQAPVLELGPGTGVFTAALIARGIAERDLTLIEADANFAALVARRFPAAHVVNALVSAARRDPSLDGLQAGAVVSGLPLITMRRVVVRDILEFCFERLKPGGAMYQFTYRPLPPVPAEILSALGLKARLTRRVLLNIPPAFVFKIERRAAKPA
jgi:phosphatidylethanolamine/phosphatidyl-N-methylethanolamine N-methyltransferase